jgi:serine/threonine-protein kinase ULK2
MTQGSPLHSEIYLNSNHGAPPVIIAGYTLEERLGSGSFANVYKASRTYTNEYNQSLIENVAIKAIARDSNKLTKKVLENLELEISILQKYRHANIVCLHQVQKTDQFFYLILEFCGGGDLQRLIRTRKSGRLSERLVRRLTRDLAAGLTFLASQNLIHRDIKPQNLLLTGPLPLDEEDDPSSSEDMEHDRKRVNYPTNKFHLKIADFGFARHLQKTSLADTLCGSPLYMAPEILQHQRYVLFVIVVIILSMFHPTHVPLHRYDNKADLWSAGTVMFEMIAGRPPFHGENHIDLLRNIQQKAVRLPPDLKVSKECVNLLRILLNRNPLSRAGFQEFVQASDEFVSLGCNGIPATLNSEGWSTPKSTDFTMQHSFSQMNSQTPHADLGPISEVEESSLIASSSIPRESSTSYSNRMLSGRTTPVQISPQHHPLIAPSSPALISLQHMPSKNAFGHVSVKHNLGTKKNPHSHFAPLEPSPPGPRPLEGHFPSTFTLESNSSHQANGALDTYGKNSHNSSDDSSNGGFVMVDKGIPNRVEEKSLSSSPLAKWAQIPSRRSITGTSPPQSQGGRPSTYLFPGKSILSSRNLIPPVSFLKKGMLSTSPGTGGLLVGAMASTNVLRNADDFSSVHPQSSSMDFEGFTRMLAAADDVGRRAVNVAHVGDTRAYLAMRLIFAANDPSDTTVSMESMEHSNNLLHGEFQNRERTRTVSNDLSLSRRNSSIAEEEEDNDDEMPFVLEEDGSQATEPSFRAEKEHDEKVEEKVVEQTPDSSIRIHFREALLCYIKALSMLKGSVNASQKVLTELSSSLASSSAESDTILQFRKRCEVSHTWLTGQFKGVLERANAANDEISKRSSDEKDLSDSSNTHQSGMASCVEELIYNHSLACGKDGAVKQLLGQYEAARACYRSAGLLAETLLMERKLVEEDKKILEEYVQGFSERINEIDSLMLHQSRHSVSASINRSTHRIQSSRRSFSSSGTTASYGRGFSRSNSSRT